MFDKLISILGGSIFQGVGEVISKFVPDPTKQAEIAKELAVLEANVRMKAEEIAAADRDSARKREVSTGDSTNRVLAYLIVVVFGAAQYAVFTHQFPPDQAIMVARVLGTIDMALGLVLGYYFGSSAGSSQKTELLGKK